MMGQERVERLPPLQKPSRGVRGIVTGDIIRRLVARTISRQIGPSIETATTPFQYALSTRVGTECVCHVLQALTDNDERATILSVDGIGAFDFFSRESMMRALLEVEGGGKVLPFVRQFYGSLQHISGKTKRETAHFIPHGVGGGTRRPPMLALFSLGQHRALEAVQTHLDPTERLFAFLDDIYVVCSPDRVWQIHEPNFGPMPKSRCTKARPKCGIAEEWHPMVGRGSMQKLRRSDPEAVVRRGEHDAPPL